MSDNREILHKEIDLIQNCISRMANNSFLLKGWLISLLAVVLALEKDIESIHVQSILLFSVFCFWYLDAFFLRTENLYKKMYAWVIQNRNNTFDHLYDLSPDRFNNDVNSEWRMMLSKTLRIFYGIPFLVLLLCILSQMAGKFCTRVP